MSMAGQQRLVLQLPAGRQKRWQKVPPQRELG
jgi:hypothetical protein